MKMISKSFTVLPLALAAIAMANAPANAQANGLATVDLPMAVANSQAFQGGYQQIATAFASQRTTIESRQAQRQQLIQTFDTNGDGQFSEQEQALAQDTSNPVVQQVTALDQELQQLQLPINRARIFVIQQIAAQYSAAVQQVIQENSIQALFSPDALIYLPETGDVTPKVIEKLNAIVPSVAATPPADWQPAEAAVNLFQEIQQLLMMAARQQQQQQQQQPQQQQPAAVGR